MTTAYGDMFGSPAAVPELSIGPAFQPVSNVYDQINAMRGGGSQNIMFDGRQRRQQHQQQFGMNREMGTSSSGDKETVLKTPVSLLNEVCAKAKVTPDFVLSEDGPPHARMFECTVTVQKQGCTWNGKGCANNKKDAKQDAAKALLLTMDSAVESILAPAKAAVVQDPTPLLEIDPDPEGNPVGDLNDMALKLKRLPPEYEMVGEEGKPHERVYTVACKLGTQIVENGKGRSKKHAKKAAAFKVKQKLTELLAQGDGMLTVKEEEVGIADMVEQLKNLNVQIQKTKNKTKATETENVPWKLTAWLVDFKNRSGTKLFSLRDPKPNTTDHVKLLKDVAEEQKFKVEYFDVQKSDTDECFSCITSIGIEPVAIFHGRGGSKTQARKNAAERALEFLEIAIRG